MAACRYCDATTATIVEAQAPEWAMNTVAKMIFLGLPMLLLWDLQIRW